MWSGFDRGLRRDWENVQRMLALRRMTPTREWPLLVENPVGELLVVREWPDGSLTAYLTMAHADAVRRYRAQE
jgi:hypothetical protein